MRPLTGQTVKTNSLCLSARLVAMWIVFALPLHVARAEFNGNPGPAAASPADTQTSVTIAGRIFDAVSEIYRLLSEWEQNPTKPPVENLNSLVSGLSAEAKALADNYAKISLKPLKTDTAAALKNFPNMADTMGFYKVAVPGTPDAIRDMFAQEIRTLGSTLSDLRFEPNTLNSPAVSSENARRILVLYDAVWRLQVMGLYASELYRQSN